jgi:hypothetical protein
MCPKFARNKGLNQDVQAHLHVVILIIVSMQFVDCDIFEAIQSLDQRLGLLLGQMGSDFFSGM